MLRKLALATLLACPMMLPAQSTVLQNVTTSDYSLKTILTKLSDTQYRFDVRLRNEQLYDPNRLFALTNFIVDFASAFNFVGPQSSALVGPVGTNIPVPQTPPPVDPFYSFNDPLRFIPIPVCDGVTPLICGTESTPLSAGYGILGCTGPITFGHGFNNFFGSTCASAGFTGFLDWSVNITFLTPRPNYDGAEINVRIFGVTDGNSSFGRFAIVSPEPSSIALMALGLLAVGMAAKKKRLMA
jgi:hypothetical protein